MPATPSTPSSSRRKAKVLPNDEPSNVVLRTPTGSLKLQELHRLFRLSRYWAYVVGGRQRFTEEVRDSLQKQATLDLFSLGVDEAFLQKIASDGEVEVCMTYSVEIKGWEQRTLPWESLLSLATKRFRKEKHICVVRCLELQKQTPPQPRPPTSALLVSSAPGELSESYSFETEISLMRSSLGDALPDGISELTNPDTLELGNVLSSGVHDIIHLTGLDVHQGTQLLKRPRDEKQHDGFLLADDHEGILTVEAEALGKLLSQGKRPRLVSFNCYYSGSRLAAMAVALGAEMAIGFQDTIDDTIAERFFATLYSEWRRSAWGNFLEAFKLARDELAGAANELQQEQQGGDVVLWTRHTLLEESPRPVSPDKATRLRAPKTPPTAKSARTPGLTLPPPAPLAATEKSPPRLHLRVEPSPRLNYSLLHNNRSPFERFNIYHQTLETQGPIEVELEVTLDAGDTPVVFRSIKRIDHSVVDLREQIRLPLVARLFSSIRESIHTSLCVRVLQGKDTLYLESHRVALQPADEWIDQEEDWRWLPSFVLPRDAAIRKIMDTAPRYLRVLTDDSSAGFDGYQQAPAPGAEPNSVVDDQVRAIWSAILYDTPLGYINPPPSYTEKAQRIRTPSQMLIEKNGTCLDLSLLFAACLEHVGIMPVIFLIEGHSFPGYWRTNEARLRFLTSKGSLCSNESAEKPEPLVEDKTRLDPKLGFGVFGPQSVADIMEALQGGGLVSLETTELTRRGSFAEALDQGTKNLITDWSFNALIDLQTARDKGVTPIPLFDQPTH